MNDEQREAIARSMTSGFSRRVWDGNFNPSPEPEYNKVVRDHVRSDYLNDADLVIAHLWERADDPEVVEAVDSICIVHGMSRTESEGLIETVLTALIGPRPQGEEAEHG